MSLKKIPVEQLRVGLFILLDGSWTDYPFMFRSFKIKNEKQIRIIREVGMKTILYDPARSDVKPIQHDLPDESVEPEVQEQEIQEPEVSDEIGEKNILQEAFEEKNNRIQQLKERRVSLNRCEKAFTESVGAVKNLMNNMRARPRESLIAAEELVGDIVGTVSQDQNVSMQLVNMKGQDESSYFHIINVTMLSLIMGKELGLDEMEMNHLGVGAMLHDFGQLKVPDKILRKKTPLTDSERKIYELHPRLGAELALKIGSLPKAVIEIMEQHHEHEDGSGYPNKLKTGQISKLSKIVAVANAYDDYCNKVSNEKLLTPYEAMSYMYSQEKFDKKILSIFINRLGVYPPGTLVRLSDGPVAGVTAVNHHDLLNPQVVVYDAEIPKEEAAIIDLSEEEHLKIEESIRRNEVPAEMLSYLNFGGSVNYFLDPSAKS